MSRQLTPISFLDNEPVAWLDLNEEQQFDVEGSLIPIRIYRKRGEPKMSWSVYGQGKGSDPAFREQMTKAFEGAKKCTASVEAEQRTVVSAEGIVNAILDHADPEREVKISGYGSACNAAEPDTAGNRSWTASCDFTLTVQTLAKVVEPTATPAPTATSLL